MLLKGYNYMSKLLTVLIKKLNSVKESSQDVTLDFSENKEAVYEDLLIPLMNLTKSSDLTQLHDSLNVIINDPQDSEKFTEIGDLLVNYLMEDNKDDDNGDLYEEFDNLMLNCMAIFNSLKKAIVEKNITTMNEELTTYINSKFKVDHDDDDTINDLENDDSSIDSKENKNKLKTNDDVAESIKIISPKDETDDEA